MLLLQMYFLDKEDWHSDRMRWTRNPVYPFLGIGGLNPSSSAKPKWDSHEKNIHFYTLIFAVNLL